MTFYRTLEEAQAAADAYNAPANRCRCGGSPSWSDQPWHTAECWEATADEEKGSS